jgi:hypothetical protein
MGWKIYIYGAIGTSRRMLGDAEKAIRHIKKR